MQYQRIWSCDSHPPNIPPTSAQATNSISSHSNPQESGTSSPPRPRRPPQAALDVLHASNRRPLDGRPVDAVVELVVHQPHGADVVAAHEVQAQRDLHRGLVVVRRADYPLVRILENLGRVRVVSVVFVGGVAGWREEGWKEGREGGQVRTRLVLWSAATRVPKSVRESAVIIRTRSTPQVSKRDLQKPRGTAATGRRRKDTYCSGSRLA